MRVPYEVIEHTADVGLRVWGKSEKELFENAARGMFAIIAGDSRIDARASREVSIEGRDLEELLVGWLSELNYYLDAQDFLSGDFEVASIDRTAEGQYRLEARVRGEPVDRRRHELRTEIKAVTYHYLEVKQEREGWSAELIFDV